MLNRVTPMYRDQGSLKVRVLGASIWTLAGFGASQVIRFGSNLLLTRLLVPDMFGVIAIATVVMMGLAMFSDVGLRQNVVQSHRGNDPVFLNTGWATQIIRGGLLWTAAIALALLVFAANQTGLVRDGSVYADGRLPAVIAVPPRSISPPRSPDCWSSLAGRSLAALSGPWWQAVFVQRSFGPS